VTKQQQRATWQAMGVGVTVTIAVLIVYGVGGLDWLELKTLDLRFQYANATPQDPRIVCIDIDDGSLDTVGRWPWPRDVQAGIISLLAELGARAVLYDITLSEPEYPRLILPRQADIVADPAALDLADRATVLPDEELRTALADAGMVYLAFHYALPRDPTLADHVADRVRAWLDTEPERWSQPPQKLFAPLLESVFLNDARRAEPVAQALRTELSLAATTRAGFVPLARVWTAARPVPAIAPVYFPLARAARRCGFVVFTPEHGVVRRVRPLVEYEGRVLPQLAFALACDTLGVEPGDLTAERGVLELQSAALARPLRIQLDREGRAIIPWVPERDWTRQFGPRIPVDALWQVYDRRLSLAHNEELIAAALDSLLTAGLLPDQRQYADDLHQGLRLPDELRRARYRDDAGAVQRLAAGIAEYQRLLAAAEPGFRAAVAASPSGSAELGTLRRALAANDAYRVEIDHALARLRERIAGRLCLVGYTASSLADMVPIPTHERAPGVLAHANLLNGLLTGRTVGWAPTWLNILIAAALGVLATVTTVGRGPRQAAALMLLLIVVFVVLSGWLAFYGWLYWIALTPALIAAAVSYGFVLLFRYVFLERESRQIAIALSQYTSPTLARKMAEDAELCRRAETREVTAVFTDLAGFTPLSERIGAERTQRLLNTCLGHLSDVIIRYEGMINKFIGDGIFAFWNPVIYPQPDHARRACQTAVDLQAGLRALIAEQRRQGGDEAFGQLVLRIGIATGNAVVGPCGSEQKYDYTCIGDSVNTASRLESANKFYGTHVLISGPTRAQAGDGFAVRPLGGVQVKGKTRAVPVFELLGRSGEVPPDVLRYADHFSEAVAAFQRRDWPQALRLFETYIQSRPDDLAACHYAEAVRHFTLTPPRPDWNGALELTEK
jgi:adenylate cyclase